MSDDIKNISQNASLNLSSNKLNKIKQKIGAGDKSPEKLKEAADQFEALFIHRLLKEMRKTVMKSDLLGDGFGGEIMRDMFDEQLAEKIASSSQLGLAEMLVKQLGENENGNEDKITSPHQQFIKLKRQISTGFQQKIKPFEREINKVADEVKLNPNLIKAVILAESGGNPDAVSPKGAKGLMQLMDTTAAEVGINDVTNVYENIYGGSKYLKKMLTLFDGNLDHALAAYNAGPSAVKKYNGVPPYKETQNYIKRIRAYLKALVMTK